MDNLPVGELGPSDLLLLGNAMGFDEERFSIPEDTPAVPGSKRDRFGHLGRFYVGRASVSGYFTMTLARGHCYATAAVRPGRERHQAGIPVIIREIIAPGNPLEAFEAAVVPSSAPAVICCANTS